MSKVNHKRIVSVIQKFQQNCDLSIISKSSVNNFHDEGQREEADE